MVPDTETSSKVIFFAQLLNKLFLAQG